LAVGLDETGISRLKQTLLLKKTPVEMYQYLSFGRVTDQLDGDVLRELVLMIAGQPEGLYVALEILFMRLDSDHRQNRPHSHVLLEAGRELLKQYEPERNINDKLNYLLTEVIQYCLKGSEGAIVAGLVAHRLRQALRADAFLFHERLIASMLKAQPSATLTALLPNEEGCHEEALSTYNPIDHYAILPDMNPFNVVPCQSLISWCKGDREHRYSLAAKNITFARRSDATGPLVWSEQAKALLSTAPDPKSILNIFAHRFKPISWSGSRAAAMEANTQLLDQLEWIDAADLISFAEQHKRKLGEKIARMRQSETYDNFDLDSGFE
jgi:hypothetical protein